MAKPTTIPWLRELALDHLSALAAELRKSDPSLSKQQAVAKAAASPEGREAFRLYQTPGAELGWQAAVSEITKRELAKGARSRKVAAPALGQADAIFATIRKQAMAAAPAGRSEAGAIADFLQTSAGQQLWRQYNTARAVEDE
jgi:hypothetical protein